MLHIPGFLKFCSSRTLTSGRNSSERNGQLDGYLVRQCCFEVLLRCTTSRWLTDGSDRHRINNFSMWPAKKLKLVKRCVIKKCTSGSPRAHYWKLVVLKDFVFKMQDKLKGNPYYHSGFGCTQIFQAHFFLIS